MEELEALLEVIGVGVLDDDISVMQRGLILSFVVGKCSAHALLLHTCHSWSTYV